MRLKSLELHGFKSFPNKTVIRFDEGATVIVGPNGSGKSNITDAMRWVLGELSSKNIRGSKMEDVIFVGADGYRPMGFAEVSVTFDNTDAESRIDSPYDEITVTRRYYRAGESEYYINRKAVRLRDIHELFMNTGIGREGYSIIGQGRIAEIVSKKSDERRGIFDETAGIAKYRFKKQEAQKKLDATEANMLRVADILTELESRVGPLERQSKKAREYLELFAQKKEIDVALWLYDMENLHRDEEKTKADCALSRHELEITQDTADQLQAQSDRLFDISQDTKQEAARLYEKIRSTTDESRAAENEYRVLENNVIHKETQIAACEEDRARKSVLLSQTREVLESHNTRYDSITKSLAETDEKLQSCLAAREDVLTRYRGKENLLEEMLEEQKKHEDVLMDLRVRLNVLKNTISTQNERSSELREDISKYEAELADIGAKIADLEDSVGQYTDTVRAAREKAEAGEGRLAVLREEETAISREISTVGAKKEALDSRISALRNMLDHFEGYNNSVRFVMKEAGEGHLSGIHGPVSHLITVKPEYTVALETAIGAAMQNIVVNDEAAAKAAMYSLKNSGVGRATFYPLTSVKANSRSREVEAASTYKGFIGFADALVSCDAKYAGVIGSILNRVAVFDTLDNATVMARSQGWRVRAVTLDGQQINAGGSFTGGAIRRDSGMLSRTAEIETLTAKRDELAKSLAEFSAKLEEIRDTVTRTVSDINAESDKCKLIDTLVRADQAQLDELTARRGVIENLMQQLCDDRSKLSELGQRGDSDVQKLESECDRESSEIARIAASRADVDVERGALSDRLDELAAEISEIQIRQAEIKKDQESETRAILDTSAQIDSLQNEIVAAREKIESLRRESDAMRQEIEIKHTQSKTLEDTLKSMDEERASLEAGSMEYERKLNEIRIRLKDVTAKKELLLTANAKNENKYQQICSDMEKMTQRLWDEYELTPTAAAELPYPAVDKENRPSVYARLSELRNQIKALGHVNLAAIDEYVEVKERYDFVSVQMNDLNTSKEELMGIIGSIDEEMTRMFTEAFDKINENFGRVFKELFGGGEAHLSLSDPENPLTSGIEISAAPPGKIIKNLSLLSGGEQSVIAIALLFALVRVNPSPFCIFDEIEAALDEVNVQRVAQYVKRISEKMQIIMITHRRGTMEVADTLYGVTMPNHGVSKVFTLDVAAATDEEFDGAI